MVCYSRQCIPLTDSNNSYLILIGFQASCVPRMGDGSAAGQLHGMARRINQDHLGFANLWRGTSQIGCGRVVDNGYLTVDRAGRGRARQNNNPTVQSVCQEVIYKMIGYIIILLNRKMCCCFIPSKMAHNSFNMIPLPILPIYKTTQLKPTVQATLMQHG